jgi:hypothetical protein
MADPLSMAVATAVAGKAAESLTGQAGQAIAAIRRKIRERFHRDPGEVPAPDATHDDPSAAAGLVRFLDAEFAADPAFRDEIRALWLQAAPAATDDAVSNVFYGKADKVVQLRDVHGDLNISLPTYRLLFLTDRTHRSGVPRPGRRYAGVISGVACPERDDAARTVFLLEDHGDAGHRQVAVDADIPVPFASGLQGKAVRDGQFDAVVGGEVPGFLSVSTRVVPSTAGWMSSSSCLGALNGIGEATCST